MRVALIPIFIPLYYLPFHWSYLAAAIVFTLASVTDWLDGYLARRCAEHSFRGLSRPCGRQADGGGSAGTVGAEPR